MANSEPSRNAKVLRNPPVCRAFSPKITHSFTRRPKKVLDFLSEVERSRKATDAAVSALAEAGVIRPWQIKLKAEQAERAIAGLYRVDEAALNALADDVFQKLRKTSGALPIAYAQMLSMGQLGIFEHLARLQAQLRPPPASALPENIDSLFEMPSGDTVQFR